MSTTKTAILALAERVAAQCARTTAPLVPEVNNTISKQGGGR